MVMPGNNVNVLGHGMGSEGIVAAAFSEGI